MLESKHRIFVYGTLKKGFSNDKFLEKSEFIGNCVTKDKYLMYIYKNGPYPFPYMLDSTSDNNEYAVKIKGEAYIISDETLAKLDWLEGTPDFYFKKEIEVLINNKIITAFCYFFTKQTIPFDQINISEFN